MIEVCNKTRSLINLSIIKKVAYLFLKKERMLHRDLSIALIGDVAIRKVNKRYRGKDKVTDVLSFRDTGSSYGEILIDYVQIKRQAKKFDKSIKEELVYILVHGLLHLSGLDDKTDKEAVYMHKLGVKFIYELKKQKKN